MSGTRLPAVRMPSMVAGQGGEEEDLPQDSMMMDLPPSSKFGFAWPAEQPSPAPLPLGAERPVTLSSSDGETDISEEELSAPVKRPPKPEDLAGDLDFVTPTNNLTLEQNPLDHAGRLPPIPRLSRAFSMPLPSQLGSLKNPQRTSESPGSQSPTIEEFRPESEHFRELSLELADSVQMVIQTLLQLSPPQVLDPAKEQFAACSLSIPTPSVSAIFTSLKNLNYISANMTAFSSVHPSDSESGARSPRLPPVSTIPNDFDVGEMLQSVGDALSGIAAQAGVDLVLFHGDVGMKHIAVKGDESGLSYTLSHVIRQVISTAKPGDAVEIGLFVEVDPQGTSVYESEDESMHRLSSPTLYDDTPLRCIFHITHRYAGVELDKSTKIESQLGTQRPSPSFDTLILRHLLRHLGASLDHGLPPRGSFPGHSCEIAITLEPGEPSAVNPSVTVTPVDAAILGYPDIHIADEPTMEELIQFTETLRGKSATLFASSKGSFAHHLSSYLTAWGMDVSHMSTESGADGEYELVGDDSPTGNASGLDHSTPTPRDSASSSPPAPRRLPSEPAFVLIDDDVAVLRSRLQKIKAEQAYPLALHGRKRPSLASNHRPRSSPQVARVLGSTSSTPPQPQVVIVHFTSLANFKLVKDVIQSVLTPTNGVSVRIPEVIVIPKPAGPRRFLTALHTAVTRPVVDPFFVPIATSPMSPGLHSISPFFNMTVGPKSPGARSATSVRTVSDKSTKSPKDFSEFSTGHAPPSPLGQSDGMEYFSDAAVKLGASPATGLIIQSPDGQPTGIFFHPKGRTLSNTPPSPNMERDRAQDGREIQPVRHRAYSRVSSGSDIKTNKGNGGLVPSSSTPTIRPSPRMGSKSDIPETASSPTKGKGKELPGPATESQILVSTEQTVSSPVSASPESAARYLLRRPSQQGSSPPSSPQIRTTPGPTGTVRRMSRRPTESTANAPKKGKGATDGNIVPPVSVLIVDDNPINQTILSTFMKKKKIKYDVAKNGEEAVQKWRSGVFHLILMDIQMPVMDGIQATKEIRRIEKQSGTGGFPSTPQSEGQRTPSEASTTDSRTAATPPYRSSVIIVALTASSLQTDRVAALAAGCNDFLTKPVSLQWLNSKIIEWGSIKALQMWADIRPEVVKSISTGQAAQAQQVARRLHVPEGRTSMPGGSARTRTSSSAKNQTPVDNSTTKPASVAEKVVTPNTPVSDDSPGLSSLSEPKPAMSVSQPLSVVLGMSANEAAKTLAGGHRPQVSVEAVRLPDETVIAPISESLLPPHSSEQYDVPSFLEHVDESDPHTGATALCTNNVPLPSADLPPAEDTPNIEKGGLSSSQVSSGGGTPRPDGVGSSPRDPPQ